MRWDIFLLRCVHNAKICPCIGVLNVGLDVSLTNNSDGKCLIMKDSLNDNFEGMQRLIEYSKSRDMNEAETRHKIIDFVIHDFLSWPKNRVAVEEYINPGFADYILKKENGDDLLFIEAKKEGVFFELPLPYSASERSTYISIKKLISDENIRTAIHQVRNYCFDAGCEYAGITNGHEWIFFKTFEKIGRAHV